MPVPCGHFAGRFVRTRITNRLDRFICEGLEVVEVFMVMNIHVVDFRLVAPYSDVVGYQRFEGPCCLCFQVGHPSFGVMKLRKMR
jgi:hypothetical protein